MNVAEVLIVSGVILFVSLAMTAIHVGYEVWHEHWMLTHGRMSESQARYWKRGKP